MEFIAHIRSIDNTVQTVKEHLLGVQNLAEKYGESLNIKHITGLAGLLHDLGKYTNEFNQYIKEAVNNPDAPPKRGSVDHSTAGGKLLFNLLHSGDSNPYKSLLAEIVGNAVISHHSYLHDFLNNTLESPYLRRVQEKELEEFEFSVDNFFNHIISREKFEQYINKASNELQQYLSDKNDRFGMEMMFLTKFIFSTLIDADRTDTRIFEENEKDEDIDSKTIFMNYYDRLLDKLYSFREVPNRPINQLRTRMSQECDDFAVKPSGIYSLSIPTGGGKTFASLRYALKHAVQYKKKRIIYVVPFTTIVEQNAQEVREIMNDDRNILEHHSNIIWDEDNECEDESILAKKKRLSLAKDNWDSPIIFTTMVQFLNIFYERSSRSIRRLHNLSDSIIIFDEVQKVPIKCVSLFNESLNFLKNSCHCSLILCTATQPALEFVEHKLEVSSDGEMIGNIENVEKAFKRVEIVDETKNEMTLPDLTAFIKEKWHKVDNMLIILNTKSAVKNLYQELKKQELTDNLYHLSTSMCPSHRMEILEKIKEDLKNKLPVICASTQLIEAGVDISFDCVIRSLAGLDSIAQAAGRCNRHGEKDICNVYTIDYKEEDLSKLKEIKVGKKITYRILVDLGHNKNNHGGSILSYEAMERYFSEFYTELKEDLNYFVPKAKINMTQLLSDNKNESTYCKAYTSKYEKAIPLHLINSYRLAADNFSVIDEKTTPVIVPYNHEGKEIIKDLNGSNCIHDISKILRKVQHYSVNVYDNELQTLKQNDAIEYRADNNFIILKDTAYSDEYGINLENDEMFQFLMQ